MDKKTSNLLIFGLPLLLAVILKGILWSPEITPFNADEAVVALMARHVNQGQIMGFFYGQAYMGSLDALIVAVGFQAFGEHVWVIRLVQSLLYLGTVATTIQLARRFIKPARGALYAGLLAAIPTVNVALYTTVSLGGYGEMLLIGNLLLLGGVGILDRLDNNQLSATRLYWTLLAWGAGAGFAFWVLGLTLVYSLSILVLILWRMKEIDRPVFLKGLVCLAAGGLVGAAPWWGAALFQGDLAVLSELIGGAIAGANQNSWWMQPINRAVNLVVFGGSVIAGLRPPWSITWLMLPLLPFVLIFWLAVLLFSLGKLKSDKLNKASSILVLMGLILSVGFIFSPFGDDPSGRYFLPLLVPMSIFGAEVIVNHAGKRKIWEIGLVGFLLIFNLGGIIQSIRNNPPGLTTQFDPVAQVDHSQISDLIEFLESNGITRGYSNYWVSYPVAFLSKEEIIFAPRLPYHEDFRYTSRDDRYPPYTGLVESSQHTAYITTRHPSLDAYLVEQFKSFDIEWQQKEIGDYTVYYQLSEPLRISEIGLGITTHP